MAAFHVRAQRNGTGRVIGRKQGNTRHTDETIRRPLLGVMGDPGVERWVQGGPNPVGC